MFGNIKVFSGRSHPQRAEDICNHLGIEVGKSHTVRFSNENLMVQIDENVRECDVFVVQTSSTPLNEHIMELLIFINALKHASAARITAVIPCFPYARSDKKDRPRIAITARLLADLLEEAGANRVLTMDLHSPQIQGFFRVPADQMMAANLVCRHLAKTLDLKNTVAVASDAGEAKDIGRYANRLNLPIAIIDKRRYGDDDRAHAENLVGDVKGKTALIVDDEISTGGTIVEATQFLLKKGAKEVVVAATHPVFSGPAPQRLREAPISRVVVTDTVPVPKEKRFDGLQVLSVAPLLAESIMRIHNGNSVSELFVPK